MASEPRNVGLELILDFLGLVVGAEFDDNTSHALGETLELSRRLLTVGDLSALVNGVEGLEVEELDASASTSGAIEGTNNTPIDGTPTLLLRMTTINWTPLPRVYQNSMSETSMGSPIFEFCTVNARTHSQGPANFYWLAYSHARIAILNLL
ncbi:hypothetical protein OPQ81_009174 [Rhizoctonia solani]|nr:hypothetical protein OPQ81_009174 [Rhizoctonia solani]